MVLVILIFFEVQATDLALTTLHHSLVTIPLPRPSKLDKYEEFHTCFIHGVRNCKNEVREISVGHKIREVNEKVFGTCIVDVFFRCKTIETNHADRNYYAASQCELDCNRVYKRPFRVGLCLLQCYEALYYYTW